MADKKKNVLIYHGDAAIIHERTGVLLQPGENEIVEQEHYDAIVDEAGWDGSALNGKISEPGAAPSEPKNAETTGKNKPKAKGKASADKGPAAGAATEGGTDNPPATSQQAGEASQPSTEGEGDEKPKE